MICSLTNIYSRNLEALYNPEKFIAINEGGTSSSKTYSILQLLINRCKKRTLPLLTSVVSESFPHLEAGCIRDFKKIMGNDFDPKLWNGTRHVYTFRHGVELEFFSADTPGKAAGPRRDILYVNEVNNISKVIFDQMYTRTRRFVFVDFNPVSEFWAHSMKALPRVEWIHSTYLDAKHVLPESTVKNIEERRLTDPNWWNIYGLGLVGNIEGLVHPLFQTVDCMPDRNNGVHFYGMDFGFSNDPTALIDCLVINDCLYCDELIYQTGLTNDAISHTMESLGVKKGYDEIFADAAEPKSIEEIRRYDFNIKSAPKGPDSILAGIQKLNQYKQYWTKRSVNAIKEMRNYRYIETSDGKLTNKPVDNWNHTLDARRYGVFAKFGQPVVTPGAFSV